MGRKRFRDSKCSIAQTLDRIGDWWTLLIIRDAFNGATSFSDFRANLGVAKNILSNRLTQLVEDGVLARQPLREGVDRFEYHLTERGYDLLPLLVALMQWGDKWVYDSASPRELVDTRDLQVVRPIAVVSQDGRVLTHNGIRWRRNDRGDSSTD